MKTLNTKSARTKPDVGLNFAQPPTVWAAKTVSPLGMGHGKLLCLAALLLVPSLSSPQQYSIDWYKIAGGGGMSTGRVFTISGTIRHAVSSSAMTGPSY